MTTVDDTLVFIYEHDGFRMMITDNTPFGVPLNMDVMVEACVWNEIDYTEHYLEPLAFYMNVLFDAHSTNGEWILNIVMLSITTMSSYLYY